MKQGSNRSQGDKRAKGRGGGNNGGTDGGRGGGGSSSGTTRTTRQQQRWYPLWTEARGRTTYLEVREDAALSYAPWHRGDVGDGRRANGGEEGRLNNVARVCLRRQPGQPAVASCRRALERESGIKRWYVCEDDEGGRQRGGVGGQQRAGLDVAVCILA